MRIAFTFDEKVRQREIKAEIAIAQTEHARGKLREELDSISVAARARTIQRSEQNQVKAEEKKSESEVVSAEDYLLPDERAALAQNRIRIRELLADIPDDSEAEPEEESDEEWEDDTHDEMERIANAELLAVLNADSKIWRKAEIRVIRAGKCLPKPERHEDESDEEYEKEMQDYHLNLKEAACYRKLNSPKTSFNAHKDVEQELIRIENRRRELHPENYESEPKAESADTPTPELEKPAPSPADMSDVKLRESFSKQKYFFRDILGFTDRGELIAALEAEIRSRQIPMYWSAKGSTCVYVDSSGELLTNTTNHVYMGEVDRPDLIPAPEPERTIVPTLTTAQRESRERWSNQHGSHLDYPKTGSVAKAIETDEVAPEPIPDRRFAYMLYDGTTLWPNGEHVIAPLGRETNVLKFPDPPGYVENSGVIPTGWAMDVHNSVWRRIAIDAGTF